MRAVETALLQHERIVSLNLSLFLGSQILSACAEQIAAIENWFWLTRDDEVQNLGAQLRKATKQVKLAQKRTEKHLRYLEQKLQDSRSELAVEYAQSCMAEDTLQRC